VYELQRFDWARDVDDSLGLSPVVDYNSGTVAHVQDTPQPVPIDPTLGQPVPANTVPVDPDLRDVATAGPSTSLRVIIDIYFILPPLKLLLKPGISVPQCNLERDQLRGSREEILGLDVFKSGARGGGIGSVYVLKNNQLSQV
jgi:hypothetical protein